MYDSDSSHWVLDVVDDLEQEASEGASGDSNGNGGSGSSNSSSSSSSQPLSLAVERFIRGAPTGPSEGLVSW